MPDEFITVSTGVKFRLKRPALFAVQAVEKQMEPQRPAIPVVFVEAKGRQEENPLDPAYLAAMTRFQSAVVERQYDAVLATGTVVESVPDGVPSQDDETWVEMLDAIGITVAAGKTARYLQWVKYVAAPSGHDLQLLLPALLKLLGATEDEVAEAVDTFRGGPERDTDPPVSRNGAGSHGDNVAAVATGARAAL